MQTDFFVTTKEHETKKQKKKNGNEYYLLYECSMVVQMARQIVLIFSSWIRHSNDIAKKSNEKCGSDRQSVGPTVHSSLRSIVWELSKGERVIWKMRQSRVPSINCEKEKLIGTSRELVFLYSFLRKNSSGLFNERINSLRDAIKKKEENRKGLLRFDRCCERTIFHRFPFQSHWFAFLPPFFRSDFRCKAIKMAFG